MTRIGQRQRYDDVIIWLKEKDLIDFETSKIIFTPGGVMEFLGYGTITVRADETVLKGAIDFIRANPNKFTELSLAKGWILRNLEKNLYSTGKLYKAEMSRVLQRELTQVDGTLKDWVSGLIKDKFMNGANRKVIANRIAIDNLQRIDWPHDILMNIQASFMIDVHHAMEHGVSYNTTRSLWRIWRNFNHRTMITKLRQELSRQRKGLSQPIEGHLPIADQISNLRDLDEYAKFKSNEDIVDTEAIHYSVIGRFEKDVLTPILYCTCDPIEAVLTRLLFFKWFYIVSYKMAHKNNDAVPAMAQGKIICFELGSLAAKYIVHVEQIPGEMDFLTTKRLDDWLDEQKALFVV